MTDLRFISRSQDGEHLELSDSDGNNFSLRVSDTLRAAVNERRLATVVESAPQYSIKEIQARLRAGESFAEVARISGLSIEKVSAMQVQYCRSVLGLLNLQRRLHQREHLFPSQN